MKNSLTKNNCMPQSYDANIFKYFVFCVFICYLFVCIIGFKEEKLIYMHFLDYYSVAVFVIMGYYFIRGCYFKRKYYIFCIIFLAWILLTYQLRNEPLLDDTNYLYFVNRCLFVGIALPFAHFAYDTKNRKYLNAFLLAAVIALACMFWLCFAGIIRGENICLFNNEYCFGATYTVTGRMKPMILGLHYYRSGYLAVACFFITLYLAVSNWSAKTAPVWIVLLLTFSVGVIITYSRTGVFSFAVGLLMTFHIYLQNKHLSKLSMWLIFAAALIVSIILFGALLNYIYSSVHSIRDVWYGISTLSSRTTIWGSLPSVFQDNPHALISGLPINDFMDVVNKHLTGLNTIYHMHSGYLQTLMITGLPGLIAVLAFCVYLIKCSIKIFFSEKYVLNSDKIMVILPIVCMLMNMFESTLFYNYINMEILNLFTALFAGYIFEKSRSLSNK